MKLNRLALALLAAPLALSAQAGQFTATPLGGYHVYDKKMDELAPNGIDDEVVYGGALGYRFTKHIQAELDFNRTEGDRSNAAGNSRDDRYSLNGLYRFRPDSTLQPYVLLGGGQGHFKVDGTPGNRRDTLVNAGVGSFVELSNNFRLRGELRAVHNTDESYTDSMALVGLELAVGRFAEPTRAAPAPEPAPAPQPVAPKPKPAPVPEADSDKDGVPDSRDKCPNTPAGALVDSDGCPKMLTEAISREVRVLFDSGKAVIKPEFRNEVEEVAKIMKQYPDSVAEIQGHTDSSGSVALNNRLSQQRADAVRSMLMSEFGIAGDRIEAKGYGPSQPVASNSTAEGKAKNRRVVAVITGERQKMQMKTKK